jgi:hypothetical protein
MGQIFVASFAKLHAQKQIAKLLDRRRGERLSGKNDIIPTRRAFRFHVPPARDIAAGAARDIRII